MFGRGKSTEAGATGAEKAARGRATLQSVLLHPSHDQKKGASTFVGGWEKKRGVS